MDYRAMDRQAEELRAAGAAIAAKGEEIAPEERDTLMKITGKLEELDRLRVEARDAEISEARAIAEAGRTVGATAEDRSVAAFRDFIRTGVEDRASMDTTDSNGGYIVPEPLHGPLIEKYRAVNPLLAEVTTFNMSGDTKMYLPRKDSHGAVTNATETGSRSEQNAPTFDNVTLDTFDYYTDQRATQTFLDSVAGAETQVINWIYEDFAEQFGTDLAVGSGTSSQQPIGIFTSDDVYEVKNSGTSGAIADTNFLSVFFSLPQKFRANSKWYMSPATLAVAMGFTFPNTTDTPLVTTAADGTFRILGKPVVEVDSAPTLAANSLSVAFGDLRQAYAAGVHRSASILRDPYTAAPYVRFYGLARMGGTPWNKDALVLLKAATTPSS